MIINVLSRAFGAMTGAITIQTVKHHDKAQNSSMLARERPSGEVLVILVIILIIIIVVIIEIIVPTVRISITTLNSHLLAAAPEPKHIFLHPEP